MAKTLLHRDEDVGVATGLDEYHAIGMEPGEMQRGREQIPPPQAPEDRSVEAGEDARKEYGCRSIVGELGAAGDLMQRAAADAAGGQPTVDRIDAERQRPMALNAAFDLRDALAQGLEDGGLTHDARDSERGGMFRICSPWPNVIVKGPGVILF